MSFGEVIKEIRLKKRLSQEGMANALRPFLPNRKTGKAQVSSWEGKDEPASQAIFDAYLKAFPGDEGVLRGWNLEEKGTSVKYSMTEEVATLVSHFNDTLEGYRQDIERLKQEKRELEEKLNRAKPGQD